ncbi:MAG: RNA 2',3'-cyclic phosphodiesterase [Alphaproteobacteria bacterium]|nr:RNA 2',3'-cyclic phosphodiesterase [Alphaproteobacteria bacterium]
MPRLFTALEIPAPVAAALAGMRGGLPGAHWVDPENYHITLCFIGDVDGRSADEIVSTLSSVRRAPLEVTIDDLAVFGGGGRPRAVIAGVGETRALLELQAEQERRLRRLDVELEDRNYFPHVTLARVRQVPGRDLATYLSLHSGFPALSFTASRFVLFSSRASTGGGPYVVEAAYELERH